MAEISAVRQESPVARLVGIITARRTLLRDYFSAISGSAGRLVFSLLYFVVLANTLSIAEFGVFATASAAGVMLSRVLALGFVSTLYRVATVRPRLIGTFTGGFLMMAALSLPLLAAAAALTYSAFFASEMAPRTFALVVAAEALLWRPFELVLILNNGLGKFGRSALLVILGTILRAGAAVAFMTSPTPTLDLWAWFYLGANGLSLLIGLAAGYPRQRLRFRPKLYWPRLPDALYIAGAEVLFYLQMEFDKLVVLAAGGAKLAGIYAIIMRFADLTAIPVRAFTMMLVQNMMRTPALLSNLKMRVGIEAGVFAVSTAALAALAILLHFFPNALGSNVSEAAPLVMLALAVPGLRNLTEYQAELLFARGQTGIRAIVLAVVGALKVALLYLALQAMTSTPDLIKAMNIIFLALYLVSAEMTYSAFRRPAKSF